MAKKKRSQRRKAKQQRRKGATNDLRPAPRSAREPVDDRRSVVVEATAWTASPVHVMRSKAAMDWLPISDKLARAVPLLHGSKSIKGNRRMAEVQAAVPASEREGFQNAGFGG